MRLALLAALLLACAASAEPNAELLARLREGGFVLYLRHTSTDFSQNDSRMQSYEDCANQRNLTDRGREEARVLGEHLKRLKIPIGEVLASPFCRTMYTARLAFGKATATQDVRGGPVEAARAASETSLITGPGRHQSRDFEPRQPVLRADRTTVPCRRRDRRSAPRRRALQCPG